MDGQRARSLRRRQSFTEEFRVIDDDGDGSLTIVELTNAMLRRHPQASAAEARSWAEGIIRVYDADVLRHLAPPKRAYACSAVRSRQVDVLRGEPPERPSTGY